MKRLLSVLTAFVLLISFLVGMTPATAYSAVSSQVQMSAYSSPETLSEAGFVDVTVLITPSYGFATPQSGLGITILSLSFEGREVTPSTYAYIGSTKAVLLEDIYIDRDRMGKELPVELTYIDLDRQVRSANCNIVIESTTPAASFSRSMSKNSGSPGDMIEIEYTVHNRSGVDFFDISVNDGFIGEIFTLDELPADKSHTKTVVYELSHDVVSRPVLTYSYEGGTEKQEKALDAKAIYVDGAALALDLKSDASVISKGGNVSITLSVRNDTDEKLSNIVLYSHEWLDFDKIDTLEPGEVRVYHKNLKLYSDCDISIAASVKDKSGKEHFCLCRTLSIDVIDKNEQSSNDTTGITMNAGAVTQGLDTALAIEIHNSAFEIKNAVISDKDLGVVEDIGIVPIGDSLYTLQREFTKKTTLELTLVGISPDGTEVSASAPKLIVEPEQVLLVGMDDDDSNRKFNVEDYPLNKGDNSWVYLICSIACAAICLVLLLVLLIQIRILIRRHRRSRQKGK